MSKHLFNNLVKLGNNNPDLRDDIKPVLNYLNKKSYQNKKSYLELEYSGYKFSFNPFEGSLHINSGKGPEWIGFVDEDGGTLDPRGGLPKS